MSSLETDSVAGVPVRAWAPLMESAEGYRVGSVALEECWVQMFEVPAAHIVHLEAHAFSEQVIQVVEGSLNISLDDVRSDLSSASVCVIPTGVHHHGSADQPTKMLVITAPVGFGDDNYRLDMTEDRGQPLAPVGSSVAPWSAWANQELRGTFVSLWGVDSVHRGRGGPVAVQVISGTGQVTVNGHTAAVDPSMITIVDAGTSFAVEMTDGLALVVDASRAAGLRP